MKKLFCMLTLLFVLLCLLIACDDHTHSYGEWELSKTANCKEKGEEKRVCECGEIETRELDFAHNFKEWTGSCDQDGKLTRKCRCGATEERDTPDYCVFDTNNVCTFCHTAPVISDDLVFTLNEDGSSYSVKAGKYSASRAGDIFLPYYHDAKPVTAIDIDAFNGCTMLTSIIIPSTVKTIGAGAFQGCTDLLSVKLHGDSRLQEIQDFAFDRCRYLTSIHIPATLAKIGTNAFSSCSGLKGVYITDLAAWCRIDFAFTTSGTGILTDANCYSNPLVFAHNLYLNNTLVTHLEIDNAIESISSAAFINCTSIESIAITNPALVIKSFAFLDCEKLKSVTFSESNDWVATRHTVKEPLASTDLANPETAALYLNKVYVSCVWQREME